MAGYEYRPAPELVRAHEQITQALAGEMRRAQTAQNLQGKDVQQRLLPIIEAVVGFAAGIQADVTAYAAQVGGGVEEGVIMFGLDADTYEDLDELCKKALHEMTEVLDVDVNGAKPRIRAAMEHISTLRDALGELVVDEDEIEGEEALEESGDDDELEIEE